MSRSRYYPGSRRDRSWPSFRPYIRERLAELEVEHGEDEFRDTYTGTRLDYRLGAPWHEEDARQRHAGRRRVQGKRRRLTAKYLAKRRIAIRILEGARIPRVPSWVSRCVRRGDR